MNPNDQPAQRLAGFLAIDPNNLTLLAELADLLLNRGELAAARTRVEQALSLSADDDEFHYRMAVIERHEGAVLQAIPRLRGLLLRHPGQAAIALELASVLYAQQDGAGVLEVLEAIDPNTLQAASEPTRALLQVRALHSLGCLDEAISYAEQWQRDHPEAGLMVAPLATLYLDAGRLQEAQMLFDGNAVNGHTDPELLTAGGFLALQASDLELAGERFESSLRAQPDLGRSQLGLGLTLAAQGKQDKALERLQAAVALMPQHPGSWHALAWLQLVAGDVGGADRSFQKALQADHNFGETHGGLAIVAALRGARGAALEHIRTARGLGQSAINANMAQTLLETGATLGSTAFVERGLEMLRRGPVSADPQLGRQIDVMIRKARQSSRPPR